MDVSAYDTQHKAFSSYQDDLHPTAITPKRDDNESIHKQKHFCNIDRFPYHAGIPTALTEATHQEAIGHTRGSDKGVHQLENI